MTQEEFERDNQRIIARFLDGSPKRAGLEALLLIAEVLHDLTTAVQQIRRER